MDRGVGKNHLVYYKVNLSTDFQNSLNVTIVGECLLIMASHMHAVATLIILTRNFARLDLHRSRKTTRHSDYIWRCVEFQRHDNIWRCHDIHKCDVIWKYVDIRRCGNVWKWVDISRCVDTQTCVNNWTRDIISIQGRNRGR